MPVFLAGVFGLLIGSFLNVVIWRVPRGESLLPNSACPKCAQPIRPWQNVPVLSWLFLRGKCANCNAPISVRYPLIELITAVVLGLVTWWFLTSSNGSALLGAQGPSLAATAWCAFAAYLWFAAASIA